MKFFTLAWALLAFFPVNHHAFAQNTEIPGPTSQVTPAPGEPPADAQVEKLERVEVTGSHIKRVDVEGVAPVDIVTKKDLEKKGYDNLGDVVRDMNANSFGSFNATGSSGYAEQGNAEVDLQGLGAEKTLVLLNGIRLPPNAHDGAVDINMIPMAAVDRIEVLRDGASALYGSDALGGVVNIITIKDFKGTQLSATQSLSTNFGGGKETNVSAVNGINTQKFSMVTSANYRYDQPIMAGDRPFFYPSVPSYWSSPGNFTINSSGNTFPSTACASPTTNNPKFSGVSGNTYCGTQPGFYGENVTPDISQVGVMTDITYQISDMVKFYSRLGYVHRTSDTFGSPDVGDHIPLTGAAAGLPGLNNYTGANPVGVNDDLSFNTAALGNTDWHKVLNGYSAVAGTVVQLPKDWSVDTNANFNRIQDDDYFNNFPLINSYNGNGIQYTGIQTLINNGSYNPLAPMGSQGSLSSANYTAHSTAYSLLGDFDVKASTNSLFSDPWGDVGFALGASFGYSQYGEEADSAITDQDVLGLGGSSGAGHRNFESFYAEMDGPIFTKDLELDLAGRFDHYSDFGSTVNPKVGLLYHATKDLLVRASWGTGFQAPLLQQLYGGTSVGYQPGYFDSKTGNYYEPQVYNPSNPDLKQITSTSYNTGVVYSPLKGLDLTLDGHYTKIDGDVATIDVTDFDKAVTQGLIPTYTYAPNKFTCDNGEPICLLRNSAGGVARIIEVNQNLAETQTAGVDGSVSYSWGKFKVADMHSQQFFFKVLPIAGLSTVNQLGWLGMPSFRNTASITYDLTDQHHFTLYWRYIPGQSQLQGTDMVYIDSFYQFDLSYVYMSKNWGTFSLTVNNIVNKEVPIEHYADGTQLLNSPGSSSLYDWNQRSLILGWKYKFD